jgi:hypothetical protein
MRRIGEDIERCTRFFADRRTQHATYPILADARPLRTMPIDVDRQNEQARHRDDALSL